MVFIHDGKVVNKKPFSFVYLIKNVGDYAVFFASSFLSNEPLHDQVRAFQSRNDPRSIYRPFSNVLGMDTSSLGSSSGGGTGGGGAGSGNSRRVGTATGRPTVFRAMPQAPLSGGCGGGG